MLKLIALIQKYLHYSATSMSKNFMIGLDLITYANADKNSIYSGFNSLNDDIFAQLIFENTTGSISTDIPVRIDFYALYDSLIVCENGTAYAKF